MLAHNKRLQYTVWVSETNPGLANLMLEQFGGPQGELTGAELNPGKEGGSGTIADGTATKKPGS